MKTRLLILSLFAFFCLQTTRAQQTQLDFDFFGEKIQLPGPGTFKPDSPDNTSPEAIHTFLAGISTSDFQPLIRSLLAVKQREELDDWLYYQLIRKAAGALCPKKQNYYSYTLMKWFLLTNSGYDARIKTSAEKILFYVRSDDRIYNIPYYTRDGAQYVCLNYHDYGNNVDFSKEVFSEVPLSIPETNHSFTYQITRLPDFNPGSYLEKDIRFSFYNVDYRFRIKLNPDVKTIFANYPVVDYAANFNIPLSQETYRSLIPLLKKYTSGMSVKGGVDYLMRFTRYAFMFKTDVENFGAEKRLTPEQTLLYGESDCEDRAALFFYLVREIYNLPMIVLTYPQHVTIAIKFDKPVGKPIIYNGEKYYVCEPTPQADDLGIGQIPPSLRHQSYEVAFAYSPSSFHK